MLFSLEQWLCRTWACTLLAQESAWDLGSTPGHLSRSLLGPQHLPDTPLGALKGDAISPTPSGLGGAGLFSCGDLGQLFLLLLLRFVQRPLMEHFLVRKTLQRTSVPVVQGSCTWDMSWWEMQMQFPTNLTAKWKNACQKMIPLFSTTSCSDAQRLVGLFQYLFWVIVMGPLQHKIQPKKLPGTPLSKFEHFKT